MLEEGSVKDAVTDQRRSIFRFYSGPALARGHRIGDKRPSTQVLLGDRIQFNDRIDVFAQG
ncbi:hypothetical protein D3C71_2146680 [compost metagenome]